MSLVGAVLLIAFVAFGLMSASSIQASTEAALSDALSDEGFTRRGLPQLGGDSGASSERAASNVPVYYVSVQMPEGIISTDNNVAASMDADVLQGAVTRVLERQQGSGRLSEYGLLYQAVQVTYGYHIAFADISRIDQAVGRIALLLVVFWMLLMLAFLIITVYLSRYVTRPVAHAFEEQQRFIADASHEIKTPLTVILADVSILKKNPEKTIEEQQAWVDSIGTEAERMKLLTRSLMTLARDDAGVTAQGVKDRVDLSEITESVALQFEVVAFEQGLMIEDDVERDLFVRGDAARLESMVKTLLENSCKYGVGGERIGVRLHAERNHAVLEVENGGQTIPEADLPRVFERFYRSDSARAHEGESTSFGLGLAIAKSTAELHGGTIAVDSHNGITRFVVRLPLMR